MIIYDSNSTIIVSADPGLSHGRGGAWDHLWCGLQPALGAATKRAKPALGAAKLWALAGQVFPFLPARNCRMLPSNPPNAPKLPNRLLELPQNLPHRLLELPNYGLWQAKSCLFYRPETAGCSLQTLQTLRNFQTGSWSCHETC